MVTSYDSSDEEDVQDEEGRNLIENFLLKNEEITPSALAVDVPLFLQVLGIEPSTVIFHHAGIGSSVYFQQCWSDFRYTSFGLDVAQKAKVRSAAKYLASLDG